jgi:hypothetical protein
MSRRAAASLLCAFALLAGACGNADGDLAAPTETLTAEATPPSTPAGDADDGAVDDTASDDTAPDGEENGDAGPQTVGSTQTGTVESDDFPSGSGTTAFLTDVRVGVQEGFDRVVFEFDGDDRPSYRIGYVQPPVAESGTGDEVEVAGEAFLEIILEPASGVDLSGAEPRETYDGPRRLSSDRTEVVREVVRAGDFEANLRWVIGVEREVPFAAAFLTDPLRLVIDIEH